jgi:hypothetical protein
LIEQTFPSVKPRSIREIPGAAGDSQPLTLS